eukprot:29557_1
MCSDLPILKNVPTAYHPRCFQGRCKQGSHRESGCRRRHTGDDPPTPGPRGFGAARPIRQRQSWCRGCR